MSEYELPETAPGRHTDHKIGRGFSARAIATIVTLAFGVILLAEVFIAPPATFGGKDNPGAWNPPRDRAELLVAKMDGHTFAQIAEDPLMKHTVAAYNGDESNAAYRSARPVMGWMYFVGSAGGQRVLLAPVILIFTALTAGAVVLATDALGRAMGLRIGLLGLIPIMPALVAAAAYPGVSEPMAYALALFGLAAWCRSKTWLAVGLFCLAALTRETTLLVPMGLGIDHLIRTRRLQGALPLLLVPASYVAWVSVVYARIGALPSSYSPMDGPFVGFKEAFPHWKPAEWLTAALLVASAVVIIRSGTGWMRAILAVHALFFVFMNYQVWWVWWGFGRVGTMLPLLGLVAFARQRARATNEPPILEPLAWSPASCSIP